MGTKLFSDELPVHKATVDGWTTNIINGLKGQANGLAPLGVDSLIDPAYLPPVALSTTWGNITGLIADQSDLATLIGSKASTSSPAFNGTPTAPTPDLYDSSYQIATTEFVQKLLNNKGWVEFGFIMASDGAPNDSFGTSISISSNGLVMAVGADQWEGALSNQGGVYIYDWNGSTWVERAGVLTASDPGSGDLYGESVALNADGTILAVGAIKWDSLTDQGAVYIYDWNGSAWVQRSKITTGDAATYDYFGSAVSLSDNGTILAVGADSWEGTVTNQGGVYIYDWNGSAWVQRGSVIVASDVGGDSFGESVSLNSDGTILAVGAPLWDLSYNEGKVYIFDWNGSAWTERGGITASDAWSGDGFGSDVCLSGDGKLLMVGAGWASWNDTAFEIGKAYLFEWNGYKWVQKEIIYGSENGEYQQFGWAVAMSGDGLRVAISSAWWETATGYGRVWYGTL